MNAFLTLFADPVRAQSAIDRFTNNSYDLVVEGESFRPRMKPKRAAETEPEPASSRSIGNAPMWIGKLWSRRGGKKY
jgi:hypothetical protein